MMNILYRAKRRFSEWCYGRPHTVIMCTLDLLVMLMAATVIVWLTRGA